MRPIALQLKIYRPGGGGTWKIMSVGNQSGRTSLRNKITSRTVATSARGWGRSIRAWGRRRRCFAGRRRRWGRLALGGLLLLLRDRCLLVVLIIGHVVLVPTIGGVGVGRSVVLGIRGAIVGSGGGRSSLVSGASRRTRRLLLMLLVTVVISVPVTTPISASTSAVVTIAAVSAVSAISATTSVATVAVLRWVVLEVLILFLNVGQKVFTKLLGSLNVIGVGTALKND
jgi:hypothetical protein